MSKYWNSYSAEFGQSIQRMNTLQVPLLEVIQVLYDWIHICISFILIHPHRCCIHHIYVQHRYGWIGSNTPAYPSTLLLIHIPCIMAREAFHDPKFAALVVLHDIDRRRQYFYAVYWKAAWDYPFHESHDRWISDKLWAYKNTTTRTANTILYLHLPCLYIPLSFITALRARIVLMILADAKNSKRGITHIIYSKNTLHLSLFITLSLRPSEYYDLHDRGRSVCWFHFRLHQWRHAWKTKTGLSLRLMFLIEMGSINVKNTNNIKM